MSFNPTIGRFMQEDPARYIDGPNTYQLEGSSPTSSIDPTGLNDAIINSSPGTGDTRKGLVSWGWTYDETENESDLWNLLDYRIKSDWTCDMLEFRAEGGAGYIMPGPAAGNEWFDIKPVSLDDPNSKASKLLKQLAQLVNKNGVIDFEACHAGSGPQGDKLRDALNNALKKLGRSDITVVLHKKFVHMEIGGFVEDGN